MALIESEPWAHWTSEQEVLYNQWLDYQTNPKSWEPRLAQDFENECVAFFLVSTACVIGLTIHLKSEVTSDCQGDFRSLGWLQDAEATSGRKADFRSLG